MFKAILPFLLLGLGWGLSSNAQTVDQSSLSNQDVVALARAGFSEDFLIDLIAMSRTQFDTSANGLAELAKKGLTERLIRAMLNPPETSSQTTVGPTPPEATVPVSAALHRPGLNRKGRTPKTNEVVFAIANQAPFYRSESLMWGLWKSKTEVGSKPAAEPNLASPLLAVYGRKER